MTSSQTEEIRIMPARMEIIRQTHIEKNNKLIEKNVSFFTASRPLENYQRLPGSLRPHTKTSTVTDDRVGAVTVREK